MRREQAGLAGHCLDDRDVVRLGEGLQLRLRAGVVHATAAHDERPGGAPDEIGGAAELAGVGPGARDRVHHRLEEAVGEIERLGLDVLGEPEEHRTTGGRVDHRRDRVWK